VMQGKFETSFGLHGSSMAADMVDAAWFSSQETS
jgi:hypothetical protein